MGGCGPREGSLVCMEVGRRQRVRERESALVRACFVC